ncbi:MAG: LysM peptidoglycan-binding domain-containing protein [Actinomycetes bacterium]
MAYSFRPSMPEARIARRRSPLTRRGRIARNIGVPLLLAALVTAGSPGWSSYTIRHGDTLSDIAKRYHTTVAKLVQVNRLPGNGSLIFEGRTLQVPTGTRSGGTATRHHRVVVGDTLSEIAHRYGVSMAIVRRANHIPSSNVVQLGTTLVIPGGRAPSSSSSNTFAGRTYAGHIVSAASRNRATLARRSVPSRTGMRNIIASKARANGVSTALALAVSYQESGWNQRSVSVANAVGAMQLIPATTTWISGVVGRRLDPLNPHDNATAGVVLLKILTRSARSEKEAVAAYYQGLKSVRENGMYPDTKHYVANVMYLKKRFS